VSAADRSRRLPTNSPEVIERVDVTRRTTSLPILDHAMNSTRILSFLCACSLLVGVAAAQTITINVGANWSLNTTSGPLFDSQTDNKTGAGTDFLNVNAFSDGGFNEPNDPPPLNGNQCQANAQGQRSGSQPLSGSASASTFTFASFTLPVGVLRNVNTSAACTPSGVLNQPPAQFLNMQLIAHMNFRVGVFGFPANPNDIIDARAEVTPPTTSGKLGSVNRLVLTNPGPIAPSFTQINGFFYSQTADASATCTLKPNSSVLANTDVVTTATIDLL
jgi:hypothetical protein